MIWWGGVCLGGSEVTSGAEEVTERSWEVLRDLGGVSGGHWDGLAGLESPGRAAGTGGGREVLWELGRVWVS